MGLWDGWSAWKGAGPAGTAKDVMLAVEVGVPVGEVDVVGARTVAGASLDDGAAALARAARVPSVSVASSERERERERERAAVDEDESRSLSPRTEPREGRMVPSRGQSEAQEQCHSQWWRVWRWQMDGYRE